MSDGGRCVKHDNWHAHCQQCCREEIATLRAQVETLTTNRDAYLRAHKAIEGSLQKDLYTAQAACVAMREALQAEEDYSQKARPSGNAEMLERAVTLRRAALATDAGAPVLALLDECAVALVRLERCAKSWVVAPPGVGSSKSVTDLLTRLKARGPTRYVSVEKVREVALEVASAIAAHHWEEGSLVYRKPDDDAIVDALMTDVLRALAK